MIDQKELHIGCWYNFKNPMSGDLIPMLFKTWADALDFEAYGEGIHLTPEWLDSMGFQKLYNNRWNHQKNGVDIEMYGDKGYVLLAEEMSNWSRHYKYVHEIQNLVSILTGEELIITSFNQSNYRFY